jgi:hypothetical protein
VSFSPLPFALSGAPAETKRGEWSPIFATDLAQAVGFTQMFDGNNGLAHGFGRRAAAMQ